MKRSLNLGCHLVACLFLFYLVGLSLTLLLLQNDFIEMRFDLEYLVTMSMGFGLWLYFIAFFMGAPQLAWWTRKGFALAALVATGLIVAWIVVPRGGLPILPAYITRKAWFLGSLLSLPSMNLWLLLWGVAGGWALVVSRQFPRTVPSSTPAHWDRFSSSSRLGICVLFGALGLFLLFYLGQGEFQRTVNQAAAVIARAEVGDVRDYLLSFGAYAAAISGLLMVFQSIIAPLPAFVITFANGLLFGWGWGAALSWSSAMAGAVLCYLLARFLGRPVVEKLVSKAALDWMDGFFNRYGKHTVFIARLIPVVSFDLVSYSAGLTSIGFWPFFWATGLGQLPATLLYSYLGQSATGTVKILFMLFVVVTALAVLGMILRPKLAPVTPKRGEA